MATTLVNKIRKQSNTVWEDYGWILIVSNLIFGLVYLWYIIKKEKESQ